MGLFSRLVIPTGHSYCAHPAIFTTEELRKPPQFTVRESTRALSRPKHNQTNGNSSSDSQAFVGYLKILDEKESLKADENAL